MICRFDGTDINDVFVDLGFCPPSNSFLTESQLNEPEIHLPLKLYINPCNYLVQLEEYRSPTDIFKKDYPYYSSYSTSWLQHAEEYVATAISRLKLSQNSFVVEVASNDGYLLQYFLPHNIRTLGVDPSVEVAKAARKKGVDTEIAFFCKSSSIHICKDHGCADLIVGNNVFAHVSDINDFVQGFCNLLKPDGVLTLEFPHLLRLIHERQFDTIYHEHFFYYSFHAARTILAHHGIHVFDVEKLGTHGGSLRIWAQLKDTGKRKESSKVHRLLEEEVNEGMLELDFYRKFQDAILKIKYELLEFLLQCKSKGKKVIGYGAAAKGNTLLNFCSIKEDLISFVVDKNPHKQGMFCPGSHIPVLSTDYIVKEKPDYVLIFPWNLKDEIYKEWNQIKDWGRQFVTAVPRLQIF